MHGSNKGGDFDDQLVKSLKEIIEDYQGGNIESFHVIVDITRLIFNHSSSTRAEKEQAFNEYAATIDAIRHQRTQAVERGRHAMGGRMPERDGHPGIRDTDRSHRNNKRRRGSPPSTDSSSTNSNGSDPQGDRKGASNKKKHVYESEMPWYKGELSARGGEDDGTKGQT